MSAPEHLTVVTPEGTTETWSLSHSVVDRFHRLVLIDRDNTKWSAQASDVFECLMVLRERLEPYGIGLCCCGSRVDSWSSGMQRDVEAGFSCYLLTGVTKGQRPPPARTLDFAPPELIATVEAQRAWYSAWRDSSLQAMREPESVWRCSGLAIGFGWMMTGCLVAVAIGLVVAAIVSAVTGEWGLAGGLAAGAIGAVGVAVIVKRFSVNPRVVLTADGVEVWNPWRATLLTWAEVSGVDAGYSGVRIRTWDDRSVTAWAVQKSNLATWTNAATRADELVAAIRERRHHAFDESATHY